MRLILRPFLFLIIVLLSLLPVAAQDSAKIDYSAWETAASEAEKLSTDETATDLQLNQTRAELVEWRHKLQAGQKANAGQITSIRNQIEALGPAPAEGAKEAEDVAARRAELNKQLDILMAPRLSAVEAFSRANSIITQIDETITERQADVLAHQLPSPLLPSSWQQAASDGMKLLQGVGSEVGARFSDNTVWQQLKPNLLGVIGYLAAAILLLTLGRRWVRSLPSRLSARTPDHARAFVAFMVSLLQIALPIFGVFLLVQAVTASGLPGEWTTPFWEVVPVAGAILFAGAWLSGLLFPRRVIVYETLSLDEKSNSSARRMLRTLTLLFAIYYLLSGTVLPYSGLYELTADRTTHIPLEFSDGAGAVWYYLLIVLAALTMFRFGSNLRKLRLRGEEQAPRYRHNILAFTGLLSRIAAVLVVVLGAFGFINLANALIWPWLLTLALIGLLILLQDFTADTINTIKRGKEGARDGLAPLIIGFVLIMLSIPVFLVIWGASTTDLEEYWGRFQTGVSLGGLTLSPGSILTFVVVFGIGYMITRSVQGAFRNSVLPRTRLDQGGQSAVVSGLGYVGIMLAAILAVTSAGIDLSSLAIVAGALSVGIGFGLQNIVSNFVSGIILLIERPISIGDWIEAGGRQGIVKRISVRSTQIETFDKTEVIVPNSDLISQPVVNWTRNNQTGRIIVPVGVAYGTDTRRVQNILQKIIEDQPLVTIDPAPFVLFRGFGTDSLNFEIRAILSDVGAGTVVTSDVCHLIAERFAAEGVEMPFAQRDIWLRNPEAILPRANAPIDNGGK